jgi:hypothetical protein
MKVIAYLFYMEDIYYIIPCPNFTSEYHKIYGEFCPHGLVDESEICN